MKPFRWGILGPGRIAQKFTDCMQVLPNSKIHAIASRRTDILHHLVNNLNIKSRKLNAALEHASWKAR